MVRRSSGRTAGIAGGSVGVVVIALVVYFLTGDPSALLGAAPNEAPASTGYIEACTAEDANANRQCRLNATIQALDAYWTATLPEQAGVAYDMPEVVSYDGQTQSACGIASAAIGPFYCPADQTIYIDVAFFDDLATQFGSSGGPLGEMYVVAHEMGHHIENLIGALAEADMDQGADSDSVRVELEADCFAGMWVGSAATTVDPDTGRPFLDPITTTQLRDALSAAAAVGDDTIQQQSGHVNPDRFTHGTSDQRVAWFTTGYEQESMTACDALHATTL